LRLLALLLLLPLAAFAQQSRELIGQFGNRTTLLVLHASERAEGGWRVAGEYIVLPTLVRRFLEGERSPQLGVTTLREGTTPILFGRSPTGELRGTWRDGRFRGTRYGPGGQERERFEFSEDFPSMDGYAAAVKCEASDPRFQAALSYAVEAGKLKTLEWTAVFAPSGHRCSVAGLEQVAVKGGLRFVSGRCAVEMRELGDFVKVAADGCAAQCGSEAYLETLLVDRRGQCRVLRPEPR
jgi:hypothetical protein